jgi:CheY-like chemotaxis protein
MRIVLQAEKLNGLRSRYFTMNDLRANHDMQITGVIVLVGLSIMLFEVFPEESVWSIPVRQADEHMIAVPASGGASTFLLTQKEEYKTLTKEQQRFCKRILIVDDDVDLTLTFKEVIEVSNNDNDTNTRIEVYTSNNPIVALSEFKPNFYDLLLVDINMPHMNGFELCEKILVIDINVRICFMSSIEINREGLREIYPLLGIGCFIRKPVTIDYFLEKIRSELD